MTLQFIDDILLFFRHTKCLVPRVLIYFTIFSLMSGLKINMNKSTIIGVSQDSSIVSLVASELGCQVGNFLISYLGIPLGGRMFAVGTMWWIFLGRGLPCGKLITSHWGKINFDQIGS